MNAVTNPIPTINNQTNSIVPGTYKVSYNGVTAPGAGRALDATMHKKRVALKYKLELEFVGITFDEGRRLLALTSPEYFPVTFIDLSGEWRTATMYRGDTTTATFIGHGHNLYSPLSIELIER